MPSLRITSCMAKVRISRFVQNGMVMRKSQRSRALRRARGDEIGGGKAEDQGHGRWWRRRASRERQKIERCASASDSVSSKMSRSKKTENQPSSENFQTHVAIVTLAPGTSRRA